MLFLCNIPRSILAELFLVGVCLNGRWAPQAESTVKDDEGAGMGGISCRRQNEGGWRKWGEALMTKLKFLLLQGRLWNPSTRQGRGQGGFGLLCCPQPEASTWCQWWISDTGEWAQQLHLHTSSSQPLGSPESQVIPCWGEIFQVCRTVKVGVKWRRKKIPWLWSTPEHVLLIEKIVYFPSHFAPFLLLAVCYMEQWSAHPAVTHLVLQIGFSRQRRSSLLQTNVIVTRWRWTTV